MPLSCEQIDSCFLKPKVRVRHFDPVYLVSLFLPAVASVTLLVIYFAVVVAMVWGAYWLARNGFLWILLGIPSLYLKLFGSTSWQRWIKFGMLLGRSSSFSSPQLQRWL